MHSPNKGETNIAMYKLSQASGSEKEKTQPPKEILMSPTAYPTAHFANTDKA